MSGEQWAVSGQTGSRGRAGRQAETGRQAGRDGRRWAVSRYPVSGIRHSGSGIRFCFDMTGNSLGYINDTDLLLQLLLPPSDPWCCLPACLFACLPAHGSPPTALCTRLPACPFPRCLCPSPARFPRYNQTCVSAVVACALQLVDPYVVAHSQICAVALDDSREWT